MANKKYDMQPCSKCGGRGEVPGVVGQVLRTERLKAGVSVRSLAKAMGITGSYLSDLELNRRYFTNTLLETYLTNLGKLKQST